LIEDAVAVAKRRLDALQPKSAAEIRNATQTIVAFSEEMRRDLEQLRAFLFARVYRHERITRIMGEAEGVVEALFRRYGEIPDSLPAEWREQAPLRETRAFFRHIADFIAGMTDRFALAEHRRLFDATPDLR
jgi:dGTPase